MQQRISVRSEKLGKKNEQNIQAEFTNDIKVLAPATTTKKNTNF